MNGAILLAETDETTLSILERELSDQGMDLVSVRSNEECMVATIGKELRLAIIALDFPGMADDSLCNLLRIISTPDLPIIGLASTTCLNHTDKLSAVLNKPVDTRLLKQTVNNILSPQSEKNSAKTAPVDIKILMEAACDEHDLALDLIQLFFETTDKSCGRLAEAIAVGDAKEISEASHKCCGASASCGMLELERRLRVIEGMGKKNQLDDVQPAYENMLKELNNCRTFLEKTFSIKIG